MVPLSFLAKYRIVVFGRWLNAMKVQASPPGCSGGVHRGFDSVDDTEQAHPPPPSRACAFNSFVAIAVCLCFFLSLVQTNKYADFFAETNNPSPLQEQRHKDKKWKKGWHTVPAEKKDGKLVAAFTRQHLYGVMGIVMTSGLTQLRRQTDQWGTSPDLDFVWVRQCMPRDFFLLFYSRFFHMAPPIGEVDKNDPSDDAKHHCRYSGCSPFLSSVHPPPPIARASCKCCGNTRCDTIDEEVP